MSNFDTPIPLSEIESVLAWVDTFKLSRPTKKINRDFSDAVLLAEILSVHYPKLVEMHNYPPRNSHSLKLNNWMTLNRKVLKKLKLTLCCNTMDQLANCNSGIIERVLVMVRDKIRRDEELNKSMKDLEQNMSSGGSFYEACGEDENVLVVPIKMRVNGVLETVQQKVVSHDFYQVLKEELKDAKDSTDLLKQKVGHLDNLLKLKEQRIDELQKQLDRKQARRKDVDALCNSLQVPFETVPSPVAPIVHDNAIIVNYAMKSPSMKSLDVKSVKEDSKIPMKLDSTVKMHASAKPSISEVDLHSNKDFIQNQSDIESTHLSYTKFPSKNSQESLSKKSSNNSVKGKPTVTEVIVDPELDIDVDRIKSDVFKEVEIIEEKLQDYDEFKDSEEDTCTTIEETIKKEINNIHDPMEYLLNERY